METKILTIVGPTASGKTSLSIALAKRFNGEIISADSRQVYRRLDIGTEKVTPEEMQDVPHHLIDVADPQETFTVSDFVAGAKKAILDITNRDKLPILAGGSGFYIDALLYNIDIPHVPPDQQLREELEKLDTHDLFEQLIKKDPKRASTIDPHNKRRLIRALEIIEALGSVPENTHNKMIYDSCIIGIQTESEKLAERIRSRLTDTVNKGLVEEVRRLRAEGLTWERLYEFGLEYRIVADHVQGKIPESELVPKMMTALQQYAKRQMTWFKRNQDIEWFSLEEREKIEDRINDFLGGSTRT